MHTGTSHGDNKDGAQRDHRTLFLLCFDFSGNLRHNTTNPKNNAIKITFKQAKLEHNMKKRKEYAKINKNT